MGQSHQLPGDLHFSMNIYVVILDLFYDELLQPIQFILYWIKIKVDIVTQHIKDRT